MVSGGSTAPKHCMQADLIDRPNCKAVQQLIENKLAYTVRSVAQAKMVE